MAEVWNLELKKWPRTVYRDEPAHGLFLRWAEECMAHSTRVFADSVGLNGRNPDPSEILSFAMKYPIEGKDRLAAGTPQFDGSLVILNGQRFRRRSDWTLMTRRVCDACLGEAAYHRNWFDLTILERCPIHDRPLLSGTKHSKMSWWYPAVAATIDGIPLVTRGITKVGANRGTWEEYVLGRMGILDKIEIALFDELDLYEAATICEVIGRAAFYGYRKTAPRKAKVAGGERARFIAFGFSILCGGASAVHTFLREYRRTASNFSISGRRSKFGWFALAMKYLPKGGAEALLRNCMIGVSRDKAVRHTRSRKPPAVPDRAMPRYDLARHLKISAHKLHKILDVLKIESSDEPVRHGLLTKEAVKRVAEVAAAIIGPGKAATLLNISTLQFQLLCKAGVFGTFIQVSDRGRAFDRFNSNDLLARLAAFRQDVIEGTSIRKAKRFSAEPLRVYCKHANIAPAEAIQKVLSGKLRAVGWDDCRPGFDGCLFDGRVFVSPKMRYRRTHKSMRPSAVVEIVL